MQLQYVPFSAEPEVKKFVVAVQNARGEKFLSPSINMFVRILYIRTENNNLNEFKTQYSESIIPSLVGTRGCRNMFLIENANDKTEFLSVPIWDSKQDATSMNREKNLKL